MAHDRLCGLAEACENTETHEMVTYCADCEWHCNCDNIDGIRKDERQKVWLKVLQGHSWASGPDHRLLPASADDPLAYQYVKVTEVAAACGVEL